MRVLITKKFHKSDLAYIKERLDKGIELVEPETYDEEGFVKQVDNAEVLLGGFISDVLLKKSKDLKFIQIPWTGVDSLDYVLLKKYKVTVCNSHSNSGVVAEHAVALMMDASKKLSFHDRQMRKGDWNRLFPDNKNEITPFSKQISGAKVGMIGFGAIAKNIYSYLSGFECKFSVFTRSGNAVNSNADTQFHSISSFKNEANDLDYLFICVPLTDETQGMVDNDMLSSLSKTCILINISRGEVIEQESLYTALKENKLGAAAIDTWYNYPNINVQHVFPSKEFSFHLLDNLVLSPHRAGYVDSGFPHLDDAIENLNRAKKGKDLINVISLENRF
jgi:lactate dehydrogenase-like 2-hydroxyacid dehydrogenase